MKNDVVKMPIKQMSRGKESFKPLKHKGTRKGFSDLEYLLALGKAISEEGDDFKKVFPNIEYHKEGIDKSVQDFAQIIYKGYKDGISKEELQEYIRRSIDIDS